MDNLEAMDIGEGMELLQAEVLGWSGRDYMVRCGAGSMVARRATGCLLKPEAGDTVLLVLSRYRAYILSVLERPGTGPCSLELGQATLKGEEGMLTIGAKGLSIEVEEIASLCSARIKASADNTGILTKNLTCRSKSATIHSDRLSLLGRICHMFVDSFIERLGSLRSTVEGIELRKTGRLRHIIKESLFMKAGRSTIKAKDHMKIDGSKIDLG